MSVDGSTTAHRLADAVTTHYHREVRSIARIAKGMGTTNWLVRTSAGDYFLKQYRSSADIAGEAAALELSQAARAAGVPAPLVIPCVTGELLWRRGDLALALFEYFPDATSGVALSCAEMAQAGQTLGRLHTCLRGRSGLRDTAGEWLALDLHRKRAAFGRYLPTIERREEQDAFDRRTAPLLHRRLVLLPRAAALLGELPPLARQVVHGDYSLWNVLFRNGELAAVVDFRPPERFLPAFEIGRAALPPETMTAGSRVAGQGSRLRRGVLPGQPGHRAFRCPVRAPRVGGSTRSERVWRPATLLRSPRSAGRSRPVLVSTLRDRRRASRQPRPAIGALRRDLGAPSRIPVSRRVVQDETTRRMAAARPSTAVRAEGRAACLGGVSARRGN